MTLSGTFARIGPPVTILIPCVGTYSPKGFAHKSGCVNHSSKRRRRRNEKSDDEWQRVSCLTLSYSQVLPDAAPGAWQSCIAHVMRCPCARRAFSRALGAMAGQRRLYLDISSSIHILCIFLFSVFAQHLYIYIWYMSYIAYMYLSIIYTFLLLHRNPPWTCDENVAGFHRQYRCDTHTPPRSRAKQNRCTKS